MPYNMTCYTYRVQTNPNRYLCEGTLKGLIINDENIFYFKCKDKLGNVKDILYFRHDLSKQRSTAVG